MAVANVAIIDDVNVTTTTLVQESSSPGDNNYHNDKAAAAVVLPDNDDNDGHTTTTTTPPSSSSPSLRQRPTPLPSHVTTKRLPRWFKLFMGPDILNEIEFQSMTSSSSTATSSNGMNNNVKNKNNNKALATAGSEPGSVVPNTSGVESIGADEMATTVVPDTGPHFLQSLFGIAKWK